MNNYRLIKISKHLRHQPERIGIKLAPGGWVSVEELLDACVKYSFYISKEELV